MSSVINAKVIHMLHLSNHPEKLSKYRHSGSEASSLSVLLSSTQLAEQPSIELCAEASNIEFFICQNFSHTEFTLN